MAQQQAVVLYYDAGAVTTSESLVTMGITVGGVAQTAATYYTIPQGITLHIQSICIDLRSTSGSPSGRVRLRIAQPVGIASPIVGTWEFYPQGNGSLDRIVQNFADLAFQGSTPSGNQIGVSQICSATTPLLTFTITGYIA